MDAIYLDSSVLVELLLGDEKRRRSIKSIIAGKRRFTSVISFGESLYVVIAISAERIYGSRGRNAVRRFIKEKHNEYVTLYECVNRMYSSLNLNVLSHPRAETMKRLIKKYTLLPERSDSRGYSDRKWM